MKYTTTKTLAATLSIEELAETWKAAAKEMHRYIFKYRSLRIDNSDPKTWTPAIRKKITNLDKKTSRLIHRAGDLEMAYRRALVARDGNLDALKKRKRK